jgi:hypothetical protein
MKRPPLDTMGIATEEFVETMRTYIVHETRTMRTACLRVNTLFLRDSLSLSLFFIRKRPSFIYDFFPLNYTFVVISRLVVDIFAERFLRS